MADKWYDKVDWFSNLIKNNEARKKAGNYEGTVKPGDVLIDGSVVKARAVGKDNITKQTSPISSYKPRSINYTTPMSAAQIDTANELHKPGGFDYLEGLPHTVLYSDKIPENKWQREVMPSHMITLPENEDDPSEPRKFIDGSRDPRAYAQYALQDVSGQFNDEQLGTTMEFMDHPDKLFTKHQRDIIKSVNPTADVKVVPEKITKPDNIFGPLESPIKKIGKLESSLSINPEDDFTPGEFAERTLFPGIAKNNEYDFMKTAGDLRNIVDNSQGHFGNLRKYIASVIGGGKEPAMKIITDGEDPVNENGDSFKLEDKKGIGYYYRMPDDKIFSDKEMVQNQVNDQGEVVLPDGSTYTPEEFNETVDKGPFQGLPDGTELKDNHYGIVQDRRGFASLATENPRTPLQDAQGRFPGEEGYNLKDNFMDAGWTEIAPFMIDTFLQSFPRMTNEYVAAGLALNDMEKSVRGIDNQTMEPAKSWKLWAPPTYEDKTETLGEMTKNTIMDPVQAGTEYMLGGIGGIGSAFKKLGMKALGKETAKDVSENTVQGVGGDFLSNAIENGATKLLGPKGTPIGRTLAAMITEGPVEEGTNSIIGSKLSKHMTPQDYGVRNPNGKPATMKERDTKERNDFITSSVAGGLMGGALSSLYKDPTVNPAINKLRKQLNKSESKQVKYVDTQSEER